MSGAVSPRAGAAPVLVALLAACGPSSSSRAVSSAGGAHGADGGASDAAAPIQDPGDGASTADGSPSEPGDGAPDPPPMDAGPSPDRDASSDEGWTPIGDGTAADGSETGDGSGALDAGDCRALALNTNSGPFGTTGPVCFQVAESPPNGWEVYAGDGRTITIDGVAVTPGQLPFPGSPPYTVSFSAGAHDYAAWAYW